ncbi:MAG: bacteriohemerythrin [Rhodospirillales bacterium]
MEDFRWLGVFATGIRGLDDDHRRLVDLVALIQKADRTGDFGRRNQLCAELVVAAHAHFQREEAVLLNIDFTDLEEHSAHHGECLKRIVAIGDRWARSTVQDQKGVEILIDTLIQDLIKADMSFKSFVQDSRPDLLDGGGPK